MDGTIFNAFPVWVSQVNEAWGTNYKPEDVTSYDLSSLKPPHPDAPSALEVLGPVFRDPQIQLDLETMPGAPEALQKISDLDIPNVICTARPIDVYQATKEALRSNRIPFDLLILSSEKVELALALSCAFSLEDDPLYAREFAKTGILSLLLDTPYNKDVDKKVIRVFSWREVVSIAKTVKFLREN